MGWDPEKEDDMCVMATRRDEKLPRVCAREKRRFAGAGARARHALLSFDTKLGVRLAATCEMVCYSLDLTANN